MTTRHKKTTVALGYIAPGEVRQEFHDSVVSTLLYHSANGRKLVRETISIQSGPRIAEARCQVVRNFLKSKAEWLWMVDADMVFEAGCLDELLAVADPDTAPIVGGLCFAGRGGFNIWPTLYTLSADEHGRIRTAVVEDYPVNEVILVAATGAAFLLVHRSVLMKMGEAFGTMPNGLPNPYPWFVEASNGGVPYGEEISFCIKARALEIPIFVDTGCKIGHMKHTTLTEEQYLAQQTDAIRVAPKELVLP